MRDRGPIWKMVTVDPFAAAIMRLRYAEVYHGRELEDAKSRLRASAAVLVGTLLDRDLTISIAESCTGGLVGDALTDIPGAHDVVLASLVAVHNDAKRILLGVPLSTLQRFGPVSGETAKAMSVGVRCVACSDISVAITGLAGIGPGTVRHPVGTVWLSVSGDMGKVTERRYYVDLSNRAFKIRAAREAIELVTAYLRG